MKVRHTLQIAVLFSETAYWLRFGAQSSVRETVSSLMGSQMRANIEHYLAGVAIPLLLVYGTWALLWGVGRLSLKLGMITNKVAISRLTVSLDSFRPVQSAFIATVFFAIVYACLCLYFEYEQATVSVYSAPARGYFQFDQFFADVIGALSATIISNAAHQEQITRGQTSS